MDYSPVLLVAAMFMLVTATVLLAALMLEKRTTARFNERFPPIDDDEFVRRCGPGVRRDVALRVRRCFSNALGIEYDRIYPEHRLVEDLGCD